MSAAGGSRGGAVVRYIERVRTSLWFFPAAFALLGAVLAEVMTRAQLGGVGFRGDLDAARTVLGTLASAGLTVLGVTLTITLAVLALTAQAYSPRAVRRFLRDRLLQITVGVFVGTITYSLLALRRVEDTGEYGSTVAVGIGFALIAIGLLIALFHHIAAEIRVEAIISAIYEETTGVIDAEWPRGGVGADESSLASSWNDQPRRFAADQAGFVMWVDDRRLARLANGNDVTAVVKSPPGTWVSPGDILMELHPACDLNARDQRRGRSAVRVSPHRGVRQDPAYGVRQIVDIALRAMSPSLNDPTTAVEALRHASALVEQVAQRRLGPRTLRDDDRVLLIRPRPSFEDILRILVDEPRRLAEAARDVTVMVTLLECLSRVSKATNDPRRLALVGQHVADIRNAAQRSLTGSRDLAFVESAASLGPVSEGAPEQQ